MKKVMMIVLAMSLGILLLASISGAITAPYTGSDSTTAGLGITDSVHDMSSTGGNSGVYPATPGDYLDRICIYCHAPHHTYRLDGSTMGTGPIAGARFTYLPLWNHALTTATVFMPYNNGAGPATGPKAAQSMGSAFDEIGSVSLLCLSCHDGTVAVNVYGNAPQDTRSISTGSAIIADQYKIGYGDGSTTDFLENHHPIGFDYDSVQGDDPEIESADVAFFDASPVRDHLYEGKMECATCHAVHNKGNSGEKLLYISDSHSNFCLTCHLKGDQQ